MRIFIFVLLIAVSRATSDQQGQKAEEVKEGGDLNSGSSQPILDHGTEHKSVEDLQKIEKAEEHKMEEIKKEEWEHTVLKYEVSPTPTCKGGMIEDTSMAYENDQFVVKNTELQYVVICAIVALIRTEDGKRLAIMADASKSTCSVKTCTVSHGSMNEPIDATQEQASLEPSFYYGIVKDYMIPKLSAYENEIRKTENMEKKLIIIVREKMEEVMKKYDEILVNGILNVAVKDKSKEEKDFEMKLLGSEEVREQDKVAEDGTKKSG